MLHFVSGWKEHSDNDARGVNNNHFPWEINKCIGTTGLPEGARQAPSVGEFSLMAPITSYAYAGGKPILFLTFPKKEQYKIALKNMLRTMMLKRPCQKQKKGQLNLE